MSTYTKIKDLSHLKELIEAGKNEFFISLADGGARSSKVIFYDEVKKLYLITNEIDDTDQDLTEEELFSGLTNIGKALNFGALYAY